MKVLVDGVGSIGKRHVSNLLGINPDIEIDIFDTVEEKILDIQKKYSVNVVEENSIDSNRYDCVLVCTPPSSHIDIALRAISAGSNVFIEKPLSINMERVNELQEIKNQNNVHVFVGYSFRFNKGINLIKKIVNQEKFGKVLHASTYFGQYLPEWRPEQDFKDSYTAWKKLGGGIILDSSHEIDYLTWIFGKPQSIQSNYVQTDIFPSDTEAICDVILKLKNNVLATIHMDYVRRVYRRTMELLCENAVIEWSLSKNEVKIFDTTSNSWDVVSTGETINDMYVEELKHALECIKLNKNSETISLENGISTLELSGEIFNSKTK